MLKLMCQWQLILILTIILWGCSASTTVPQLDVQSFLAPAVAYQPRGYLPGSDNSLSRKQVIEDLRLLRKSGFRSLVTYGANGVMGFIPEIARNEGFDGMIVMGIWDIFSKDEWNNALKQAPYVSGYCLGNEGLGIRYSPDELAAKMDDLRRSSKLPVTTSEPIASYLGSPHRKWLLSHSDWLFPIAHPFWHSLFHPKRAVDWITMYHDYLTASTGKRVILKEAGMPTGPSTGLGEDTQLAFFHELESTEISFFYFEAFDQPWKGDTIEMNAIEAHWGLYYADGRPKKVARWMEDGRVWQ
jgi:exo-beta-1,3-glucanase (GH17 family)